MRAFVKIGDYLVPIDTIEFVKRWNGTGVQVYITAPDMNWVGCKSTSVEELMIEIKRASE